MTFSALTILILSLVAAFVVAVGAWAYSTANRLDRLHVRSDLSWLALDAALARRAVVVRSIAASIPSSDGRSLAVLADTAERADRAHREAAENTLSSALAKLDSDRLRSQLVAELADAEARVLIARRFHNDAVRDTLALRARRPVRWLHLGGTAPLPTYFEIAERVDSAGIPVPGKNRSAPSAAPVPDRLRTSARVVLLDEHGRVLLLRGHDPATSGTHFWFTVGGAIEPGETSVAAAIREISEETGLQVSPDGISGPMWRRVAVFPFDGEVLHSEELFFTVQVPAFEPDSEGFTVLERRMHLEHRWFTPEELHDLVGSGESVYPQDLPRLLEEARQIAEHRREPEMRAIR